MKGILFLCLVSLASGAIDGTVTNRTTGKPQPGATVTLYKLSQAGLESIESVKSDAAGKFRILLEKRNASGCSTQGAAGDMYLRVAPR